jgi:biopolymer transport protein ExbB
MIQERIFEAAHFADNGVLVLLTILCAVSIAMIVERYVSLKVHVDASRKLRESLRLAIQEGRLATDGVRILAGIAANPSSLEGRVTHAALGQLRSVGTAGVPQLFDTFISVEKPHLERFLGFLATVGSNAPYIGLFGTVLGIMKAFQDMSKAGDGGSQAVMAGISGALIATAAGLMVAIPAVLAYNIFQKQVKLILSSVGTCRELVLLVGDSSVPAAEIASVFGERSQPWPQA